MMTGGVSKNAKLFVLVKGYGVRGSHLGKVGGWGAVGVKGHSHAPKT